MGKFPGRTAERGDRLASEGVLSNRTTEPLPHQAGPHQPTSHVHTPTRTDLLTGAYQVLYHLHVFAPQAPLLAILLAGGVCIGVSGLRWLQNTLLSYESIRARVPNTPIE